MQQWEYLRVYRVRDNKTSSQAEAFDQAGTWKNYVYTRDGEMPLKPGGFEALLDNLGRQGWELSAIAPRSDFSGVAFGGYPANEVWVFKRPLEGRSRRAGKKPALPGE
jgi:hypothetical protein